MAKAKTAKDPEALLAKARTAAKKFKLPAEPLSRAEAIAAAPWPASAPPAWEKPFREAFADELESRGAAAAAKKSGASGTRGYGTNLMGRLLYQTREEFAEQSARAKAEGGLSWSTWARRKLSAP